MLLFVKTCELRAEPPPHWSHALPTLQSEVWTIEQESTTVSRYSPENTHARWPFSRMKRLDCSSPHLEPLMTTHWRPLGDTTKQIQCSLVEQHSDAAVSVMLGRAGRTVKAERCRHLRCHPLPLVQRQTRWHCVTVEMLQLLETLLVSPLLKGLSVCLNAGSTVSQEDEDSGMQQHAVPQTKSHISHFYAVNVRCFFFKWYILISTTLFWGAEDRLKTPAWHLLFLA